MTVTSPHHAYEMEKVPSRTINIEVSRSVHSLWNHMRISTSHINRLSLASREHDDDLESTSD